MSSSTPVFNDRTALWQTLQDGDRYWDLVIVGGGIIGAGVLREAARRQLKVLLVEQRDFAWGTSSRSSKMVHGGLRYISQGHIGLTRDSLRERERLLREAPGLIERMGYYFTLRSGQFPGRLPFGILLTLYDWLAGIKNHRFFTKGELQQQFAGIGGEGLNGAMYYTDTVTDDARLVLRVLQDAVRAGGRALNYVRACSLLKTGGQVTGVVLENTENGEQVELHCKSVINATGAWADRLRNEVNPEKRIRPLRGSHLVIPRAKLPVEDALTLFHPVDKRPVFIFPWEGTTVIGTTDLDHREDLDEEPVISEEEMDYLLEAVHALFPANPVSRGDIVSTWSGVRPVIASDKGRDPSKERRDHAVWSDNGLVTVTGGKLTTFRLIALDALNAAAAAFGSFAPVELDDSVFKSPEITEDDLPTSDKAWARRLIGRYGEHAKRLLEEAPEAERQPVADTQFCLAECRWAARNESVVHLDDLLLRRTRLGALLEQGAQSLFPELEEICARELQWSKQQWQAELARYREIWTNHYYLPAH
ncbi:MAG: glycerol-3-phosphate dehydrogenase/oxidase [Halioglobus sp.]|nr:glycerol-3-phosphate dehydrogenase/oxidase [Halioglobus sp.]